MIVISHRGYWQDIHEKNTRIAFDRSFALGFGTETDIRDHHSQLVISHDMANDRSMTVESFFDIYKSYQNPLPLALNIKADGLQAELKRLLAAYDISNYFIFDMAVPDGIMYVREQLNTYTRQSEYEPTPAYYEIASGIWLDEFLGHWITDNVLNQHIEQKKAICLVSPELHKREHMNEWHHYRQFESQCEVNKIMLCTDLPEQAKEFFNA